MKLALHNVIGGLSRRMKMRGYFVRQPIKLISPKFAKIDDCNANRFARIDVESQDQSKWTMA
jgi:hypothetical protein